MLKINIDNVLNFVPEGELHSFAGKVSEINKLLYTKSGKGSDFLGWLDLPSRTTVDGLKRINNCAGRLAAQSEIILVIGIGGSYLGARATIDALSGSFSGLLTKDQRKAPLILYAGENISEDYHAELLKILDKRDYSIIVISKSGTTTEPAIAFRIFKDHIEKKYGKEKAKARIAAVTDRSKGALKKLADAEGYETFIIPDDVGGRFSVLTPVGLLPIATAGLNIEKLIHGSREMEEHLKKEQKLFDNPADLYAAVRNLLYHKGKVIEIFAGYEPNMSYFVEWWKQLYGESEGKEGKGIFPAGVNFTADLHSMGQLIQEGMRNIFETMVRVENSNMELKVPYAESDPDGLNFLSGRRLGEINKMAELGTTLAHTKGGVPVILLSITKLDEENLGGLIYFFQKACAVSAYLLGVNPFDQPGVEEYKKNMFALLGKPGFEKGSQDIKKKLKK